MFIPNVLRIKTTHKARTAVLTYLPKNIHFNYHNDTVQLMRLKEADVQPPPHQQSYRLVIAGL